MNPENPDPEPWYAVRCIFLHHLGTYEERIILIHAESAQEALDVAAADALEYVETVGKVEWIGTLQCHHLFASTVGHRTEVFSLMRDSRLSRRKYVRRFFVTGREYLTWADKKRKPKKKKK